MKRVILAFTALATIAVASLGGASAAQAANPTLDLYFSAPFVQGSEVNGNTESFNAFSTGDGACATSWDTVGSATGDCRVNQADSPGGATAGPTDPTPTVSGSGSNYAATPWTGHTTQWAIDVTFTAPVKYVGFWWSAGNGSDADSYTNQVDFYSGETKVATMTADDVTNILGTFPEPFPGTDSVTSLDGSSYLKGYYFGNPRGYPSTAPTDSLDQYAWSGHALFTYLNLYVSGDYSIDRMVISGDGFEFDNVVTSTNQETPSQNLVLAKSIDVTPPPGPSPDNGGAGLPDTGIVWLTFGGVATLGTLFFFLAWGAFGSRSRLRLWGIDVEVRSQLEAMTLAFERMEWMAGQKRRRDELKRRKREQES